MLIWSLKYVELISYVQVFCTVGVHSAVKGPKFDTFALVFAILSETLLQSVTSTLTVTLF